MLTQLRRNIDSSSEKSEKQDEINDDDKEKNDKIGLVFSILLIGKPVPP